MEVYGEKINISSGPSKQIAGLKKMMKMMMTPRSDLGSHRGRKAIS